MKDYRHRNRQQDKWIRPAKLINHSQQSTSPRVFLSDFVFLILHLKKKIITLLLSYEIFVKKIFQGSFKWVTSNNGFSATIVAVAWCTHTHGWTWRRWRWCTKTWFTLPEQSLFPLATPDKCWWLWLLLSVLLTDLSPSILTTSWWGSSYYIHLKDEGN